MYDKKANLFQLDLESAIIIIVIFIQISTVKDMHEQKH